MYKCNVTIINHSGGCPSYFGDCDNGVTHVKVKITIAGSNPDSSALAPTLLPETLGCPVSTLSIASDRGRHLSVCSWEHKQLLLRCDHCATKVWRNGEYIFRQCCAMRTFSHGVRGILLKLCWWYILLVIHHQLSGLEIDINNWCLRLYFTVFQAAFQLTTKTSNSR